jgi:hypothetical protein
LLLFITVRNWAELFAPTGTGPKFKELALGVRRAKPPRGGTGVDPGLHAHQTTNPGRRIMISMIYRGI